MVECFRAGNSNTLKGTLALPAVCFDFGVGLGYDENMEKSGHPVWDGRIVLGYSG